ncbi:MAG: response regulator [Planctomycetaceae bacterium]|nr:response regulator [Planctomycetaceae bacterium]MBP61335.1 response regulator [Planctomycetaceae bacterium]
MEKYVLLCDDEIDILLPTKHSLKRVGVDIICAVDGQQAWELISEHPPTVLVTDWQMPKLNGVELVKRIRGQQEIRHLPVVMITAKHEELLQTAEMNCLQLAAIIAKPFSPRELSLCVEQIVETGANQPTL